MTHTLTKESDVYSLGVVLFQVLCGTLCCTYSNFHVQHNLVPKWIESYTQKQLSDIIFKNPTIQPLTQSSLKTFSDIAYRCLKESREDRPKMAEVVIQLENALDNQEFSEWIILRIDYEEMARTAESPLNYSSEDEVKKLLSKGVLLKGGITVERKDENQPISDLDANWEEKLMLTDYEDVVKWSKNSVQWTTMKEGYSIIRKGFLIGKVKKKIIWFFLDKNGKKCHMISARAIATWDLHSYKLYLPGSRFGEAFQCVFRIPNIIVDVQSHLVSPQTTYACYLVYKLPKDHSRFEAPILVEDRGDFSSNCLYIYFVSPQTPVIRLKADQNTHNPLNRPNFKGLPKPRYDGWMEVQIWEFLTSPTTDHMIPICLALGTSGDKHLSGLIIEGVEFRPA